MDIIGSPIGGNGVHGSAHDPAVLRGRADGETAAADRAPVSLGGENDSASRQLARYVKETGENDATDMNVKLIWRRDRFLRGGDQISFLQRGWPAVRFTEPNENFDHQHQDVRVENGKQFGDLAQFVDFHYLARVTRVIGSSLAALARSPRAPRNARIITANLALRHRAALEREPGDRRRRLRGRLARLDRGRCGPTRGRVGNVTDSTIKGLNKDDYQVGVRAIDRDGNRSPVAFPVPANQ